MLTLERSAGVSGFFCRSFSNWALNFLSGKPHVGTLSVNAFTKMRKLITLGEVVLDARLYGSQQINDALVRMCQETQEFSESEAEFLRKSINSGEVVIRAPG